MDIQPVQYRVHPKEKVLFFIKVLASLLILLPVALGLFPVQTLITFGVYGLFFMVLRAMFSFFFIGHIKGNAVKLSDVQFPEAYALLKSHSQRLGLLRVPHMYVLQGGGILNAMAMRFAGSNFIVMYSDMLEAAYDEGMDAISFVIGHELGHIKRHHVSFIKFLITLPACFIPFLSSAYSRACEYTCDNIGYALCPEGAARGILILAAGKKLYKKLNVSALLTYARAEHGIQTKCAELFSTHPTLVKRLASIQELNKIHGSFCEPTFVSPRVVMENQETQL